MFANNKDKETYTELMLEVKQLNIDYRLIRKGHVYKVGKAVTEIANAFKNREFKEVKKQFKRWRNGVASKRFLGTPQKVKKGQFSPNFFSDDRIAVYTVIFGEYDFVPDPYCFPDNIDYYIVTDQNIMKGSCWKKVDISRFEKDICEMSNSEKNRFFKMKPHLLFPNYVYSIYIDGNVQVISDLTEYIHDVGACGLAAHMHSIRDCVYEESKAVVFAKKETQENMDIHLAYLRQNNFPEHFGMLECNVLVRKHNNNLCIEIMDEWWNQFLTFSKRDQISLPYVLFKNGISIYDVGTLGNNVNKNPSFRITSHL